MKAFILEKNYIKKRVLLTLFFLGLSLLLPQILHFLPIGNLGKILRPINFSVILCGLILGKSSGVFMGLTSPLCSYLLFNMPQRPILAVFVIECVLLGFFAGLIKEKISNNYLNVLITIIMSLTTAFLILYIGNGFIPSLNLQILLNLLKTGYLGIIVQIVLIPILAEKIEKYIK
ncbi:hypothetical protein [Fusobacterium sp. PH5-44]|uniref:hypothetical protein n=1 Tax=unclassified Fusobacterium TaxID=2648384 RepID=UPI003D212CAA